MRRDAAGERSDNRRLDAIELARVDDRHEEIPDVGTVRRLIEQGSLPVKNGSFQSPFNEIGIHGRACNLEKPDQGRPKR